MRTSTVFVLSMCVLGGAAAVSADDRPIDCSRKSLAEALNDDGNRGRGRDRDDGEERTIRFTGICAGPIVIRTDGISLIGVGTAS